MIIPVLQRQVFDSSIPLMIMNSVGVVIVMIALPFFHPLYKRMAFEQNKMGKSLEID